MRKQPFMSKSLHHNILKEAQLVDALDTLMTQVSHPQQLTTFSDEDIQRIAGNNTTTTKQLRATLQLAHLLAVPQKRQLVGIRHPRDIVQYCRDNVTDYGERRSFLIGLNTKNMITTSERIPEEAMHSPATYQRLVFHHLIIHKCASGILVHMVGAGAINPPLEEVSLVKQIADAGDTVGISILDAIMIAESDFFSFKEHGLI
ncbi:JAB domain-containing protein [Brevibacillus brevis]|uniref:JAB domain-containing protein n=1 Tax=Brevibacillus brevis TaxID=1393 RepID=UPI0037C5302A